MLKRVCIMVMMNCLLVTAAFAAEVVVLKRSDVTSDVKNDCRRESFSVFSDLMQRDIQVRVVLPPEYDKFPDKHYPIIYALHGRGAPFATFTEMGPLRLALANQPMIVVSFDGGYGSFYVDAIADGRADRSVIYNKPASSEKLSAEENAVKLATWEQLPEKVIVKYSSFFFEEYVPTLDSLYRVNAKQRAITGFSMGGFGAMHLVLQRPNFFKSASGLSSAFYDAEKIVAAAEKNKNNFALTLGEYSPENQAYATIFHKDLIKSMAKAGTVLPPFYEHCGSEDSLLGANKEMAACLNESGYAVTYKESAGKHDWNFWVGAVADVIDFHWQHFDQ